jgi:predicted dinucleotide-utilizing enzyme
MFKGRKIIVKAKRANGDEVAIEEPTEDEKTRARSRILMTDDEIDNFADRIAPKLREAIKHDCIQGDLLESLAEGQEIIVPTLSALAAEAVDRKVNGAVKKGAIALPVYEDKYRALRRRHLVQEGGTP